MLWIDAAGSMEGIARPVPCLSFGVVTKDPDGFLHVVAEVTAQEGGDPVIDVAIPKGMSPRIIKLGRVEVPPEFKQFWGKAS